MIYGYCRISTAKQNIDRQERNILKVFPDAHIVKEIYTGTKQLGRKKLEGILKAAKGGDTIVFDSVSRMSRNAEEGVALYMDLYDKDINLVFLKEPLINTETYRSSLNNSVPLTGDDVDLILSGVNAYLKRLAARQIELAFEQAQKEVDDLRDRTKEGLITAKLNGKQIGQKEGAKLNVKKAMAAKEVIRKNSIDFGGSLSDADCIKLCGCSRNSYYKYKRELKECTA